MNCFHSGFRALPLLLYLLTGCLERQPEEFAPPVIGGVQVEAGFEDVRIDVQVAGAWSVCGVYFGEAGKPLTPVAGERTEKGFSVTVSDLEDESEYLWRAFVGNGRTEVCSEEALVKTTVSPYLKLPDPMFAAWIVSHYDTDGNGRIDYQEAALVDEISSQTGQGAKSLEGIGLFPNLETLIWEHDLLPGIDLSQNPKLKVLSLRDNQLYQIDLSNNGKLQELTLAGNGFTSLDLRDMTNLRCADVGDQMLATLLLPPASRLEELRCGSAALRSLDLSGCPRLEVLSCSGNQLSSLDLSVCAKLRILYCGDNKLTELDVSGVPALVELGCNENPLSAELDLTANPSLELLQVAKCPDLETIWLKTGHTISRGIVKDDHTQVRYTDAEPPVRIPDPGFKAYLTKNFDVDGDGEISPVEASWIIQIDVCSDAWNIRSLKGIERMPKLKVLRCWGTWIDDLNLDQPYYYIGRYREDALIGPVGTLMEVDVSHNPDLVELNLGDNSGLGTQSRTIDLSHNPKLEFLDLSFTDWDYPDLSSLTELRRVYMSHLHGAPPDISRLSNLRELRLDWPQDFRTDFVLHAANHPDLEKLWVSDTGGVDNLYILPKLKELGIGALDMTEIDVSRFPPLDELIVSCNPLTSIDLSSQPSLKRFACDWCELQTLDVSCLPKLEWMDCAPQSTLKTVYVAEGQNIPGITSDRNPRLISPETQVVVK